MNLSDFQRTTYTGLYVSKESHTKFGKKYIARFQLNKKRYMKVLGYDKVDNLTDIQAYSLLEEYKSSLSAPLKPIKQNIKTNNKSVVKKDINISDDKSKQIKNENKFLKSIIGNYKDIDLSDFH